MEVDEYLTSDNFLLFMDEVLRDNAYHAAEELIKKIDQMDIRHFKSIYYAASSGGLKGLTKLVENRKKIDMDGKNEYFWDFVSRLFIDDLGPDYSYRNVIQTSIELRKLFVKESGVDPKTSEYHSAGNGENRLTRIMEYALTPYIEHFICHYRYKVRQGAAS